MEPNQQSQKLKGIDIISELPDPILCNILSHLPTKYAVATSILSTRWKSLFPFFWVPPIVIDLNDTLRKCYDNNSVTSFYSFTEKLIYETLANVSCIQAFKLKCQHPYEDEKLLSWVHSAMELNAKELFLQLRMYNTEELFDCLNGYTTLTRLELGREIDMVLPDDYSVSFPHLKTLALNEITFVDALYKLIECCPTLEDLSLNACSFENHEYVIIQSAMLKNLTIYDCGEKSHCSFSIETPSVQVLRFTDCPAKAYYVSKFKSLLVAIIDVQNPTSLLPFPEYCGENFYDNGDDDGSKNDVEEGPPNVQFADGVNSLVADCSSSDDDDDDDEDDDDEEDDDDDDEDDVEEGPPHVQFADGVNSLVAACSNTVHLYLGSSTIEEYAEPKKGEYSSFLPFVPSSPPICLELHLKEVVFWVFKETEDEIKLVEYFLNNGKVIRTLKLGCLPFKDESTPHRLGMLPGHSKIVFQERGKAYEWFAV